MNPEQFDEQKVIRSGLTDPNIEGVYTDSNGQRMLDRRYTMEAIGRMGLTPRTADLNIIGPDRLPVPSEPVAKEATRASVKSELLRRGLPGVSL